MTRDARLDLNVPTAIGAARDGQKTESFETKGRHYSGTAFFAMNSSSLVAGGPM